MRLLFLILVVLSVFPRQGFDEQIQKQFGFASARPILEIDPQRPQTKAVAERITRHARNGTRTFVAEDGSAIAIWVGTVDKMGVEPPRLLTDGDRYRMLKAAGNHIAYNVSQERNVQPSPSNSPSVPLSPLVLLDRYRTLCGTGVSSAMDPIPQSSVFLAVIDDRMRGPKPNIARRLSLRGAVGSPTVVGANGDTYVLAAAKPTKAEPSRVTYLKVESRTLQTRTVSAPDQDQHGVRTAINRRYPDHEFVPTSQARWNGRTYFMSDFRQKGGSRAMAAPYVWDGQRMTSTEPWAIVGASFNGRYGWLLNRETGKSWLITKG